MPANAPQILEGALSVTLCYLLFVFLLYFWQDFRRWQLAGEIHIINGSFDLILHSRDDLFAISQHLDKLTADQPLQDTIRTAVESAAIRLPESQAKLVSVSSSLRRLNWLQWFRVTVIEALLPITLGIFGLYKISTALLPFICAIMN